MNEKKMNVPGGPAFARAFAQRAIAINEQKFKQTAQLLKSQLQRFAEIASNEEFSWSIHVCVHPECFVWAVYNSEDAIPILGTPQQFCWNCDGYVCDAHWIPCDQCTSDKRYCICVVCMQCQHCANLAE
jgi:hypothetical protein